MYDEESGTPYLDNPCLEGRNTHGPLEILEETDEYLLEMCSQCRLTVEHDDDVTRFRGYKHPSLLIYRPTLEDLMNTIRLDDELEKVLSSGK